MAGETGKKKAAALLTFLLEVELLGYLVLLHMLQVKLQLEIIQKV